MNSSQVELVDARHEVGDAVLLRLQIATAAVVVVVMVAAAAAVVALHQDVIPRVYVRREAVRQLILRQDSKCVLSDNYFTIKAISASTFAISVAKVLRPGILAKTVLGKIIVLNRACVPCGGALKRCWSRSRGRPSPGRGAADRRNRFRNYFG